MMGTFTVTALVALSTGVLPLGIPPLPEMQLTAKIAPADCLFYMSSSGMAEPDANSPNQTEQLLAEPEVGRFTAEIERLIREALDRNRGPGGPPLSNEEMIRAVKLLLTRPTAIYVTDVKISSPSQPPEIQAGAMVHLGDQTVFVQSLMDRLFPPQQFPQVEIGGAKWTQIRPPEPGAPLLSFGITRKCFLLGVGEGEIQRMLDRARGTPPDWLTQLHRELPVDRVSTVTYFNVKKWINQYLPLGGPPAMAAGDALGLMNVTAFKAVTGMDQTACVSRILLAFDGQPQGIFKLADARPLTVEDLSPIPKHADFAMAARLNLPAIFDTLLETTERIQPDVKPQILALLSGMEREFGVKLREDFLDSLGETVCLYDFKGRGPGILSFAGVISLKDRHKAIESYQKIMNKLEKNPWNKSSPNSSMPSVATTRGLDPRIYSLVINGAYPFMPSWCMTDQEFIFAINPRAIDSLLKLPADSSSIAQNPVVIEMMKGESAPIMISYTNTPKKFGEMYPQLLGAAPQLKMHLAEGGLDLDLSTLPVDEAIQPYLVPSLLTVRRTKAGLEATAYDTLPGMNPSASVVAVGVATALLLPAIQAAREAARREVSKNNMKQIALALHIYLDAHKCFPPAYSTDPSGKPLLSWRVLILPCLDEGELYDQFHLDEPWDSDHNKQLIARMPRVYQNPNGSVGEGKTHYLTVRGLNTIFPGKEKIKVTGVTDGLSKTVMTVEVPAEKAVIWTKPDDFEYNEQNPLKGLTGWRPGIFLAGFADGAVQAITNSIDPTVLKALFTRNGREETSGYQP
ncbi:MAG: DUF1559 domain-containing protein [Pirellulales bacterium]|nr:DUF1559 domain-containing protein [Pirellulales bacterium]